MLRALELAVDNVSRGGGPFGAVIVRNGLIISEGVNNVTSSFDPTAHAEIVAIRLACQKLHSFHLPNCTLYTTCEPCPMCLAASYWARIDHIYYGASRDDAAAAGFDDRFLYQELRLEIADRKLSMTPLLKERAQEPFKAWAVSPNKIPY
ncbi:MAG: guaD [Verrucomicrobiales bacterium]|nr:guaD [Verrucomicrobiales bacterium]